MAERRHAAWHGVGEAQRQDSRLYIASNRGDLAGVEAALRNDGANLNARCSGFPQRTPLHAASRNGHLAIVSVLLDAGVDTEAVEASGRTALHGACTFGRLEVVRELVRRGADIFAQNQNGSTPFDCSASNTHDPSVSEFLLQHYRETIHESEGRRSLLTILKQGTFSFGQTRVTIQIGRWIGMDQLLSMLRYFVEQDLDCIREQDDNGDLPLHIAVRKSAPPPVIQYLAQQDSTTLHIPNQEGALPIHLACRAGGPLRQIKCLVEANGGAAATLGTCDSNGFLPLHSLCGSTELALETIEYLTKAHPAALWTQNSNGALPLHVYCESPNPSLKPVECLIRAYPAALSTQNHSGDLPLTLAGESASLSVIYTLLRGDPQVVCPEEE